MRGQASEDLLAMFDSAPLNARYWVSFAIMAGCSCSISSISF